MEHRWGQRYALDRMVSLRAGAWHVPARLMNISTSGAYLLCAVPDASVVRIRVQFRQELSSTRLVAYVVRRTRDGIGVEWSEFAPEAVSRLLRRPQPESAQLPAPPADSYSMRRDSQAGTPAELN